MPKKRAPLSDDPWANEIEETQKINLSQKIKSWGESALLVTVAGSIIVVIGQLAGTAIPIMFGAEDASNFAISIEPNSAVFGIPKIIIPYDQRSHVYEKNFTANAIISVEDFHNILRPYKFKIFLTASNVPKNIRIKFSPNEVKAGDSSTMEIIYYHNYSSYIENSSVNNLEEYREPLFPEFVPGNYSENDFISKTIELENDRAFLLQDYIHTGNRSAFDELYSKDDFNEFSEYPINIEGIGGDGRRRNTTIFVSTKRDYWDSIAVIKGGWINLGGSTSEDTIVIPKKR